MSLVETAIKFLTPIDCLTCGKEGSVLCEACIQAEILPHGSRCWRCGVLTKRSQTCKKCRPNSPKFVWISTDYEGTSKKLLKTFKFNHLRETANIIAGFMAETFKQYNSDETIAKDNFIVVPVPTATSRIRERSFGHAELLAKNISYKLKMPYSFAVGRMGQQMQRGSLRDQRLKQTLDKYYVKYKKMVEARNILLIDDVVTTGGTIQAVYKTLRKSGAKNVSGLVFAKKL